MPKKIVNNLNGLATKTPSIWLMRQAGRYLPEYRKVRETAGNFLNLCYNPDLATEVTLQPIRRYGFDAAILFADILLVPHALGLDLGFLEGEGPVLSPVRSWDDITKLAKATDIHEKLEPVYQTVRNLKSALPNETALIGFAGAPWTVATYMVAGKSDKDQFYAKKFLYEDRKTFLFLIRLIENATIEYLSKQIEAGAEIIKLFDSWAGSLSESDAIQFSLEPMHRIAKSLKERYPHIKIIAFPRGVGATYYSEKFNEFDALAVDSSTSLSWASDQFKNKTIQGNLDPILLEIGGKNLDSVAKKLCNQMKNRPFIFNLGHGIRPTTNPDHVARLVEVVREFS